MGHELHAIAETKDGDAEMEDFCFNLRCIIFIDAARTTGKDDALGLKFFNLCNCFVIRVYFTVYVVFTDAPCNKLVILTTKIDDDH